ncbi:MAG TPA: hypothetical protein VE569_10610 [Acidimicrobiia bacterium]|jgi:hypothetical protein|nr:hypothetical protein [Acidimicrobiia bacterium]
MTTTQTNQDKQTTRPDDVFADPVAYLAKFGIEAQLVADTTLREAA